MGYHKGSDPAEIWRHIVKKESDTVIFEDNNEYSAGTSETKIKEYRLSVIGWIKIKATMRNSQNYKAYLTAKINNETVGAKHKYGTSWGEVEFDIFVSVPGSKLSLWLKSEEGTAYAKDIKICYSSAETEEIT